MPASPILATILVCMALGHCLASQRHLIGTTLSAPCWWCVAGLATLLTVAGCQFAGWVSPTSAANGWLLGANLTLCPGVALLGAKRPQDRSWQWIVASFWLILSLPPLQQFLLGGRAAIAELHPARAWFIGGTILFTAANSLVSRQALAVLAAAGGQWLLFAPYCRSDEPTSPFVSPMTALAILAASVLLTAIPLPSPVPRTPLDRLWLDFRSAFGLVWALRVQEAMNEVARAQQWDVALGWRGFFAPSSGENPVLTPAQSHVLQQAFRNHLRRFVSSEWIEERLAEPRGFAKVADLH